MEAQHTCLQMESKTPMWKEGLDFSVWHVWPAWSWSMRIISMSASLLPLYFCPGSRVAMSSQLLEESTIGRGPWMVVSFEDKKLQGIEPININKLCWNYLKPILQLFSGDVAFEMFPYPAERLKFAPAAAGDWTFLTRLRISPAPWDGFRCSLKTSTCPFLNIFWHVCTVQGCINVASICPKVTQKNTFENMSPSPWTPSKEFPFSI